MSIAMSITIKQLQERVAALEALVAQLQAQPRRTLTVPKNG